jgi:hypothetical protein
MDPTLTMTSTSAIPDVISGLAAAVGARDWPRLAGWIALAVLAAANLINPLRWVSPPVARLVIVYAVTAIGGAAGSLIAGAAWSGALGAAVTACLVVLRTPGAYATIERSYDEVRP